MSPLDAPTVLLNPGEVNEAARAAAGHVRPAAVAAAEEVPRRPELCAPVMDPLADIAPDRSLPTSDRRVGEAATRRPAFTGHRTYCVSSRPETVVLRVRPRRLRLQPRGTYSAIWPLRRWIKRSAGCLQMGLLTTNEHADLCI